MNVSVLSGCKEKSERIHESWETAPAGPVYDDTTIFARIKTALTSDPDLRNVDIEVKVKGGDILLEGSVDSQEQFDRAAMHAWIVDGVKKVDNQITLKGEDDTTSD